MELILVMPLQRLRMLEYDCDTLGHKLIWSFDIWSPTMGPQMTNAPQPIPSSWGQAVGIQKYGDQKSRDKMGSGQNAWQLGLIAAQILISK